MANFRIKFFVGKKNYRHIYTLSVDMFSIIKMKMCLQTYFHFMCKHIFIAIMSVDRFSIDTRNPTKPNYLVCFGDFGWDHMGKSKMIL